MDQPFEEWKGFRPDHIIAESQRILREASDALRNLGAGNAEQAKISVIENAVEQFNKLDASQQFIETIEREDIGDVLIRLAEDHGVRNAQELIDRARDW